MCKTTPEGYRRDEWGLTPLCPWCGSDSDQFDMVCQDCEYAILDVESATMKAQMSPADRAEFIRNVEAGRAADQARRDAEASEFGACVDCRIRPANWAGCCWNCMPWDPSADSMAHVAMEARFSGAI
jgi:hypothetical protein